MSNASMLAAVRAATPSDPFPGAPAPVAVDPFPGAPRTGVGLVTSAYPGDSLLASTPDGIAGASSAPVADTGRDTASAVDGGGVQVHHQSLVFGGEQEASGYGPEALAVLEGMEPVHRRPDDHVVGTGVDRRATSAAGGYDMGNILPRDPHEDRMRVWGSVGP